MKMLCAKHSEKEYTNNPRNTVSHKKEKTMHGYYTSVDY